MSSVVQAQQYYMMTSGQDGTYFDVANNTFVNGGSRGYRVQPGRAPAPTTNRWAYHSWLHLKRYPCHRVSLPIQALEQRTAFTHPASITHPRCVDCEVDTICGLVRLAFRFQITRAHFVGVTSCVPLQSTVFRRCLTVEGDGNWHVCRGRRGGRQGFAEVRQSSNDSKQAGAGSKQSTAESKTAAPDAKHPSPEAFNKTSVGSNHSGIPHAKMPVCLNEEPSRQWFALTLESKCCLALLVFDSTLWSCCCHSCFHW